MAKVIEVEIEVGSKQALKSLQDLETAQEQLLQQLKQTEIGTDEYRRLQKQLKTVSNEVKDLELGFEALDKEQRATALVDTFTGLAGAVTAATGAFTLLGGESQELEEVEKRILGLLAVTSGLRDVSNAVVAANKLLGPSFNELGQSIKTAFTTGTISAKAFKAALASIGIGLLVAGVVELIQNFDKLFPKVKTLNEELGYTDEEMNAISTAVAQQTTEVNLLVRAVTDETKSEKERQAALDQLNKKYPNYFGNLTQDINDTAALTRQKDKLIDSLIREARVRAAQDKIAEIAAKNINKRIALQEKIDKATKDTAKAQAELNEVNDLGATNTADFVLPTEEEFARVIAENPERYEEYQKALSKFRQEQGKLNESNNELARLNAQEIEDTKFLTSLIDEETAAISANGGATTAQTTAVTKNTEAKKEQTKETEKEIDLLKGRTEAFEQDAAAVEAKYQQETITLKEQLDARLITQAEYDRLEYEQEQKKLQELLALREFYGLSTLDLQEELLDQSIAFKQKDAETTKETEKEIENVTLARLQAVQSVVGNLSGLFKEGSDAAKAAALTEIATNTALGFVQGLDIAQKGAKATGPLAPFAFPIFYASQIASVLGAVNKAKEVLGKGGGTTAPTVPSAGSVPSAGGVATGAPGGLFDVTRNEIQTSPGNTGAIRTYVLAGDVANGLEANQQIQRRRKF